MRFIRDTRHLWTLLALLTLAAWGVLKVRARMVPESFGEQGSYRADALAEIAARPSMFHSDAVCHGCHQDVAKERAESLHKAVRCIHCHGLGREHIDQARKAAKSPGLAISSAAEWDGSFLNKVDLFVTHDQRTCLVCHESAVGMPKNFKKINVAEHLEEQGASDPLSNESCFECHGAHDTKP